MSYDKNVQADEIIDPDDEATLSKAKATLQDLVKKQVDDEEKVCALFSRSAFPELCTLLINAFLDSR
jgi:hypothetical protein